MKIIFDLDGTLFQTQYCVVNAVNKLFDELHLVRPDEMSIAKEIGKKSSEFLCSLLPEHINPAEVIVRFRELEHIEIINHGILFDNVIETLDKLITDGHSLCICSTGSIEYIELVLKHTNIDKFFTDIYSAKQYNSKAEVIKNIITNNKNAIVIGDTFYDIEAAGINNIPSILALYGYGGQNACEKATFLVNKAIDIVSIIKQVDIFYQIKMNLINNNKRIIGINSVDTSGKTTLANNFSRFLQSIGIKNEILHIDDFHNPSAIRYKGDNEIDAYYNNAFNYQQAIEEVFVPLKENGSINKDILCLDLDTDKYDKLVHFNIDKNTVLLIEGVLLFRKPLIEYIEGKIFIHISFEEVINRATVRDVPKYGEQFLQKYYNKYIPIQKRYIEEYNPLKNSDIIIDNEDFLNPKII